MVEFFGISSKLHYSLSVGGEDEKRVRGWFSLQAVSACSSALTVQLRAQPARDWRISFQQPLLTEITPVSKAQGKPEEARWRDS